MEIAKALEKAEQESKQNLSANLASKDGSSLAGQGKIVVKEFKSQKILKDGRAYGTGRRKSSVARVWLKAGKGKFEVNKKPVAEYFPREYYRNMLDKPFVVTNNQSKYDVICTVSGGGMTGQCGAILHGIARALNILSEENHGPLKEHGLLTRDPRKAERKKYGRRKARKVRQFSKR